MPGLKMRGGLASRMEEKTVSSVEVRPGSSVKGRTVEGRRRPADGRARIPGSR